MCAFSSSTSYHARNWHLLITSSFLLPPSPPSSQTLVISSIDSIPKQLSNSFPPFTVQHHCLTTGSQSQNHLLPLAGLYSTMSLEWFFWAIMYLAALLFFCLQSSHKWTHSTLAHWEAAISLLGQPLAGLRQAVTVVLIPLSQWAVQGRENPCLNQSAHSILPTTGIGSRVYTWPQVAL